MTVHPDLTDRDTWTDDDLDHLRVAVLTEQERRVTIDTAASQAEQINERYVGAIGRQDGDDWTQPLGAHDAYRMDAVVAHSGKTWESTTPNNVWEPGVSGWREKVAEGYPAWVQPTGGHDAYNNGNRVSFEGTNYESRIDGNTWSPADYPAGWRVIDPAN